MRLAALDLGTNSFCLLVVEARPDGTFEPVVREKEVLRLGDDVATSGVISAAHADQAVGAVRRLGALASAAGAEEIVACATSALREARNGGAIADRIEEESGIRVDVISGRREAEIVFRAVQASVVLAPAPALCLDLGGGSLELAVGDSETLHWASSVHLGAARLTAELVRSDPLSEVDVARVRERCRELLEPLVPEVTALAPQLLVGTSGSLCDQARMAAAGVGSDVLVTPPKSVNQLTVGRQALGSVRHELLRTPVAGRKKLPGIEARRADLAPAAALVLDVALDAFGFDAITTGEWGLREGIVLEAIGRHDPVEFSDPSAIRRVSVADLARRCGNDDAHATHVRRLAGALFDGLQPLHLLDAGHRELLDLGAELHDIGEHVAVEGHHRHSAYLIEHGRLRGFSPREVDVLCCLARFHRGGDPKSSYPQFGRLDDAARREVRWMVALLRVADGLDKSHLGVVRDVEVTIDDTVIGITLQAADDDELEVWGARRKIELLEKMAARDVRLISRSGR